MKNRNLPSPKIKKRPKFKKLGLYFGLILTLASTAAGVFLIGQRQELRKAAMSNCGGCSGTPLSDFCGGDKPALCDVSQRSCHGDCLKAWGRCCNECAPGNSCDDGHWGPIKDCTCKGKECRGGECRSPEAPGPSGGGCEGNCCTAENNEGIWEFKCKTFSEGGNAESCSSNHLCLSGAGRCDNSCNDGIKWHQGPTTVCFDNNPCTGQQLDLVAGGQNGELIDFIIQDCSKTNCGGSSPTVTPTPTNSPPPTATPVPTETPIESPTPTPYLNCACEFIRAYDLEWQEIADLSLLQPGSTIYLGTQAHGDAAAVAAVDKARFRINGGEWIYTTDQHQVNLENIFFISYTLPSQVYQFVIEAEIHHPELGWL
jgi:hypothetical protein